METTVIAAPFGWVTLSADGGALISIDISVQEGEEQLTENPVLVEAAAQFSQYFKDPTAPFSLPHRTCGTLFQNRVWEFLRAIPPGRTESYAGLARQAGSGPRAIAGACKANPFPIAKGKASLLMPASPCRMAKLPIRQN